MTTLAHRSALRGPRNGGVAARRAVVRWAWRMFRREWRQQILVRRAPRRRGRGRDRQRHDRLQLGRRRRRRVRLGQPPARVRRRRSAKSSRRASTPQEAFGTIDVIGHRSFAVPGGVETVEFRAQDPRRRVRGRAARAPPRQLPGGPRQVAVTDGVAELLGRRDRGRRWPSTAGAGPSSASSRTRAS